MSLINMGDYLIDQIIDSGNIFKSKCDKIFAII